MPSVYNPVPKPVTLSVTLPGNMARLLQQAAARRLKKPGTPYTSNELASEVLCGALVAGNLYQLQAAFGAYLTDTRADPRIARRIDKVLMDALA